MAHCCDWTVLSAATYQAVARPVAADGLAVECEVHGVAAVGLAVVGLAVEHEAYGLAVE